ncbi:MAG: metal-dependent transcriptional regulator [Bacilli bacterium]|nr:metal-dependent transcriptional regulator [Bacilli bacterium]
MNIYESAEDYLERILQLKEEQERVIALDIANSMNYSKASVSRAMKNLRENGYILVDGTGSITLTDKGYEIASRIYERHKTIAKVLMMLGVSEENAYKDACKIEHDLSEETYTAIKKHMELKKK